MSFLSQREMALQVRAQKTDHFRVRIALTAPRGARHSHHHFTVCSDSL